MQKKKKEMLTWFCNSDIPGSCKQFLRDAFHYDSVTILSSFVVFKEIFAVVSESAEILYIDGTMHKH